MADELFIVVRNWEKFQHYNPEKRTPPWIKMYNELLDDPHYLSLTATQRALLHGIWMLYAIGRTYLPLRLDLLNTRLNLSVKMSSVEALVEAGFVELRASAPLAERYHRASARSRSRDIERDVELQGNSVALRREPRVTSSTNNKRSQPEAASVWVQKYGHHFDRPGALAVLEDNFHLEGERLAQAMNEWDALILSQDDLPL